MTWNRGFGIDRKDDMYAFIRLSQSVSIVPFCFAVNLGGGGDISEQRANGMWQSPLKTLVDLFACKGIHPN